MGEKIATRAAYGVALAAMEQTPGTADDVLPVYLRLSQAERERQERMSNSNKEEETMP